MLVFVQKIKTQNFIWFCSWFDVRLTKQTKLRMVQMMFGKQLRLFYFTGTENGSGKGELAKFATRHNKSD